MPERRFKCNGNNCLACWRNNLKHGCPQAQKYLKDHPEIAWNEISGERRVEKDKRYLQWKKKKVDESFHLIKKDLHRVTDEINTIGELMESGSKPSPRTCRKLDKLLKQRSILEMKVEQTDSQIWQSIVTA